MIDSNSDTNQTDSEAGANGPVNLTKLKEYGKKAYAPLINVVAKYQDEFTPYLSALIKGLQGGLDYLSSDSASEPEKYVASFFREAADGLRLAEEKLQSKDIHALTNYLSDFSSRKPSVMFGSSYVVGLVFGRLSRHIINSKKSSHMTNEPPSFEENIH